MRSSGITVFTETSSSFILLILHKEIQEILPVLILHSEDKSSSTNSTYRRQGDLLSSLQDLTKALQPQDLPKAFQFFKDIPDIPVIHDIPAFQALLHVSAFLQLECKFYTPIGFH